MSSPRSAKFPTPATVHAVFAPTSTVAESAGGVAGSAPAVRMATVYVPGGTVW